MTDATGSEAWPSWPQVGDRSRLLGRLAAAADRGLWTLRANPAGSLARVAEGELCALTGRRHCLMVSSGTVAVELAARAVGAGPNTEVIVPALGWHATAAAVRRTGARVVFADVDPRTSCVAPESVTAAMTERTVAIVAVHLHCATANMAALAAIARKGNAALIEDAAQAHGARLQSGPIGSHGTISCFSFNQEKLLAAGEGGAVLTDDRELHDRVYAMRTDGYCEGPDGKLAPSLLPDGYNAAISEFQAAVLLDQLEVFAQRHKMRATSADELEAELVNITEFRPLEAGPGSLERSYYEFGIVAPKCWSGAKLDSFGEAITGRTGIHLHRTDPPVASSPLYDGTGFADANPPPGAAGIYATMLVFHHRYLLDRRAPGVLAKAIRTELVGRG